MLNCKMLFGFVSSSGKLLLEAFLYYDLITVFFNVATVYCRKPEAEDPSSYVHPYIQKTLSQMQNGVSLKNSIYGTDSNYYFSLFPLCFHG